MIKPIMVNGGDYLYNMNMQMIHILHKTKLCYGINVGGNE